MSMIEQVMDKLGLTPPPPPTPPPEFISEQTPLMVEQQGVLIPAKIPPTVDYGAPLYNVHLGLDPVKLEESFFTLKTNMIRMRRDAVRARNVVRNWQSGAPLFGL